MEEPNIRELLERATTIAVYGMSRDSWKPAHTVPAYLIRQGYTVLPVNPYAEEILGLKSYARLEDVPGRIDILNVFRPSGEVPAVVREALQRRERQGDIDVIWLQLGIVSDEAQAMAEEQGVLFLQDRCIYIDHKLSGAQKRQTGTDGR